MCIGQAPSAFFNSEHLYINLHPLFQGFERYQSHTARCERTPEREETAEEFQEVDVLCHHHTAGNSGDHCRRSHPAMEEGQLAWPQTQGMGYTLPFPVCVICVQFMWVIRDLSLYLWSTQQKLWHFDSFRLG